MRKMLAVAVLALVACGGGGSKCEDVAVPVATGECTPQGSCPQVAVGDDAPATTPGYFKGFADAALQADPATPDRIWMAYSWPFVAAGRNLAGDAVSMATVASHLARSDDGGATFAFVRELYAAFPLLDPEGSGQTGMVSSETVSLAVLGSGAATTWYGAHLRYFLQPVTGYEPRYGTSWTVRIGSAPTPEQLGDPAAQAAEVVLGVSGTAAVYGATVHVDALAGLPLQRCAMINNPSIFTRTGTLYLVVECLAFVGQDPDFPHSTIQLLATTPAGAPRSWIWRYAGMLADDGLAQQLGTDTVLQPEVSEAADGTSILIVSPAHADPTVPVGTVSDGCVAFELASVDPPALRRDCAGNAVVRARLTGDAIGSCAHDPASVTGLVPHRQLAGEPWVLYASGVRP